MDWIVAVAIFVAGLFSGYTIKVGLDIRSEKSVRNPTASASDGSVAQSGNVAGGHIAGGDIHTETK
jgi:hypothetical protein